jgi:hypothetical protein
MKDETDKIDEICFDALNNLEVQPSKVTERKIIKRLFFLDLYKFHMLKIAVLITASISFLLFIIYLLGLFNIESQPLEKTSFSSITKKTDSNASWQDKTHTPHSTENKTSTGYNSNKGESADETILGFSNKKKNKDTFNNAGVAENDINAQSGNDQKVEKDKTNMTLIEEQKEKYYSENNQYSFSEINPEEGFKESIIADTNLLSVISQKENASNTQKPEVFNDSTKKETPQDSLDKTNTAILNIEVINSEGLLKSEEPIKDSTIQAYKKQPKKNPWSLECFIAPSYTANYIFGATSQESIDYSDRLKDVTKPGLNYTAGININYLYRNWQLQSGIAYTRINEKIQSEMFLENPKDAYDYTPNGNIFNYTLNGNYYFIDTSSISYTYVYTQDSIIHVSDTIWNYAIDTSTVSIFDSTLVTIFDTNNRKTFYNFTTYLEVPLLISYEFPYDHLSFYIKGGLVTGFLIKAYGKKISNNDFISLIDVKGNSGYANIIYTFSMAVGIRYKLNEHFDILAEPYYRRNINSLFVKNYPVTLRYNTFGLRVGLRYLF